MPQAAGWEVTDVETRKRWVHMGVDAPDVYAVHAAISTSSPHGRYVLGYTRATLARTEGCDTARWSESLKARLGSDCRLKFACMKAELLVIADQHCRGEYVPGPCTHRPSHHGSKQHPKPVA